MKKPFTFSTEFEYTRIDAPSARAWPTVSTSAAVLSTGFALVILLTSVRAVFEIDLLV